MRPTEEFTRNCIVEYLQGMGENLDIQQGSDPPDYVAEIDGEKFSLEITECKPLILENGRLVESETSSCSVSRFMRDINNKYKEFLPDETCLFYDIRTPLSNFTTIKREIERHVQHLINQRPLDPMGGSLSSKGEVIKWHIYSGCEGKAIIAVVSPKYSAHEYRLDLHVINMLEKAIIGKTLKTQNLIEDEFSGHWLGLLVNYFLADRACYEKAIDIINVQHCFRRIFIVSETGEVISREYPILERQD